MLVMSMARSMVHDAGGARVESNLLLISGQVRLYPVTYPIPFCSTGGSHTSVSLHEKNVVLEQLIGDEGASL